MSTRIPDVISILQSMSRPTAWGQFYKTLRISKVRPEGAKYSKNQISASQLLVVASIRPFK